MALDFVQIKTEVQGKKVIAKPVFIGIKSKDLMIRGREFYAFWNEDTGFWDREVSDLYNAIDKMTDKYVSEHYEVTDIRYMREYQSGIITQFNKYCKETFDNFVELDTRVIFNNVKVKKTDYASRVLPYPLEECDISAYDELMRTLYNKDERQKIEWAIGSVIAGDSKDIQKFMVLYGASGTGKSTVLNIIQDMLDGYCAAFRAKDLGNPNNTFALEPLTLDPLIAIDQDGDLSRIEDNTRLNAVVSHEYMSVNAKYAKPYQMRFNTFLMIGTNTPVKITDAKSGIVRRLIDVSPSGRLLARERYDSLMTKIQFEYPGIAYHCLQLYLELGKTYYDKYKPATMIDETNDMYNFVRDMLWEWKTEECISLASAWKAYKDWCEDAGVQYPLMKRKFKAELRTYFDDFKEHTHLGDNVYVGLKTDPFKIYGEKKEEKAKSWLNMKAHHSILDDILANCKAQYATEDEIPKSKWVNVKTTLKEINTGDIHYVKVPENHIVIDFDLKNDKGEKDPLLNFEAASKFPQTYAELSKGGSGIHLHYIYDGDVTKLSRIYDDDIEVKVFTGGASLRRRLSKCNDIPPTTINSGLPLKGEKSMVDIKAVENERHLRALVKKCLNKENHGHTKPEVDFMKKLLDDAYAAGVSYDIRDLRPQITAFAMDSTNQAQACFEIVSGLHYCSKDHADGTKANVAASEDWNNSPIIFYDVEVFPNLFIVCWKKEGEDQKVTRMINPTPDEVKKLFNFRLVGFNNRRYDNHIIYARAQGYTNAELFRLSQRIIGKSRDAFFGEAYGLSYTDIYDYCSNANKMGLKKWEIKLGIFHMENAYPWDQDVPEDKWNEIADYCCNDVIATEAVWNATQADFRGRLILAELSGLTVNDTSNTHTQQIIFGNNRNPQSEFNYPDLSKEFPGYEFKNGVSTYMGETVGEGGWVYARPGMYVNTVCEDVSGMHPASIYAMKLFGEEYTERYYDLVRARTYIKHKEYDKVAKMFDGRLAKYLGSDAEAKELSNALKTPINSVYGLTAAKFMNRCRDPRNKDNVVAKRGALFMITLKHKVEDMGYTVIHCKTDSIKIADPDTKILKFVEDFGKKYGYTFEVEDTFERICLVNGSTFIAKNDDTGEWEAKAAQFAHPYVFKSLFTHDDISFDDLCETKEVKESSMYLDMNEGLPDVSDLEKEYKKRVKAGDSSDALVDILNQIAAGHDYHFIGKIGRFTPVVPGAGGGILLSSKDQVKYDAVTGTKGFRWFESDTVKLLDLQDKIDMSYFDGLCDEAIKNIEKYGAHDIFIEADHDTYASYARSLLDTAFCEYMQSPIEAVEVGEEIPFR